MRFLACLLSSASAQLPAYAAWPMKGGNAMHSGDALVAGAGNSVGVFAYETGGQVQSSPAVGADGVVYVASGDQYLYALYPDGSLKWKYDTGGAVSYSSPAVDASGVVYVGSDDAGLHAVYASDGTRKWRYETSGSTGQSSPAVDADGVVYVGSKGGSLYAIRADGTLKWSYAVGDSEILSSPAVDDDGVVYVGSDWDNTLHAVNGDGTSKWTFVAAGSLVQSSPVVRDGVVYFGCWNVNVLDVSLYAVDADDGALKWSYQTGDYASVAASSPAVDADGVVYVGASLGGLYAVDEGALKWRYATGGTVASSPVVGADGVIYVGSSDGKLHRPLLLK